MPSIHTILLEQCCLFNELFITKCYSIVINRLYKPRLLLDCFFLNTNYDLNQSFSTFISTQFTMFIVYGLVNINCISVCPISIQLTVAKPILGLSNQTKFATNSVPFFDKTDKPVRSVEKPNLTDLFSGKYQSHQVLSKLHQNHFSQIFLRVYNVRPKIVHHKGKLWDFVGISAIVLLMTLYHIQITELITDIHMCWCIPVCCK